MYSKFFLVLSLCVFTVACGPSGNLSSPEPVAELPEPDSKGAMLLKQYCGNCHGLPRPGIHKKNEWSNVVYRMNIHRIKRALGAIPEADFNELVYYMEKHSQ